VPHRKKRPVGTSHQENSCRQGAGRCVAAGNSLGIDFHLACVNHEQRQIVRVQPVTDVSKPLESTSMRMLDANRVTADRGQYADADRLAPLSFSSLAESNSTGGASRQQ
jgi:hypothetical protein